MICRLSIFLKVTLSHCCHRRRRHRRCCCRSPSGTGGCPPWRAACNRTRTPAPVWMTDWEAGTSSLNTGRTRQSRISGSGGGGWQGWISSSGSACTLSPQSRAPRQPRARQWEISRFFPVGPRHTCWCDSSTQTSPLQWRRRRRRIWWAF